MPHKDAMNQLKMSQQQSIITLWQHGGSFRRIARELQLRRETVSKYVRQHEAEPEPAKVPAGVLARSRSQCEPWRAALEQGWQAGLSAQRLYQDLVAGQHYASSYDAVKRFVRRLLTAEMSSSPRVARSLSV